LVINKEDRGEADRVFTLYTKDFGKVKVVGRGIRKITSKLKSGIEIFFLSEIEFVQGKTQNTLIDTVPLQKFPKIRGNLKKMSIAYRMTQVLDELIKGSEPDLNLWNFLIEVFNKLENYNPKKPNLDFIFYFFLWNLFSFLGYQPQLYFCVFCQKRLPPKELYFIFEEGGIACQNCFLKVKLKEKSILKISPQVVKILRLILEKNWQILKKIKISKSFKIKLKEISEKYFLWISSL